MIHVRNVIKSNEINSMIAVILNPKNHLEQLNIHTDRIIRLLRVYCRVDGLSPTPEFTLSAYLGWFIGT